MATSLTCRVSAISAFCWPTTQTPLHNQQPSQYRSHKASYSNFSPNIGCHGNVPQNLEISHVFIEELDAENPPVESNTVQLGTIQAKLQPLKAKQVAQLSQRDHATHELLRFAKLRSGIFEPPFGGLRGNVDASCVRRWKKRGRLPIGDN